MNKKLEKDFTTGNTTKKINWNYNSIAYSFYI